MNPIRLVLIFLSLSALSPDVVARVTRGIAYRQAGVFVALTGGTGGGEICFRSNQKTRCFFYDAPIKARNLKKAEEFRFGAIYQILYKRVGKDYWLKRIHFTGKFNREVKEADEMTYSYYEQLSRGEYSTVYHLFTPYSQSRFSLDQFRNEVSNRRYEIAPRWIPPSPVAAYGIPTFGTKIIQCSKAKAIVYADLLRFTDKRKFARFDLIRLQGSWRISQVRTISEARFEKPYS